MIRPTEGPKPPAPPKAEAIPTAAPKLEATQHIDVLAAAVNKDKATQLRGFKARAGAVLRFLANPTQSKDLSPQQAAPNLDKDTKGQWSPGMQEILARRTKAHLEAQAGQAAPQPATEASSVGYRPGERQKLTPDVVAAAIAHRDAKAAAAGEAKPPQPDAFAEGRVIKIQRGDGTVDDGWQISGTTDKPGMVRVIKAIDGEWYDRLVPQADVENLNKPDTATAENPGNIFGVQVDRQKMYDQITDPNTLNVAITPGSRLEDIMRQLQGKGWPNYAVTRAHIQGAIDYAQEQAGLTPVQLAEARGVSIQEGLKENWKEKNGPTINPDTGVITDAYREYYLGGKMYEDGVEEYSRRFPPQPKPQAVASEPGKARYHFQKPPQEPGVVDQMLNDIREANKSGVQKTSEGVPISVKTEPVIAATEPAAVEPPAAAETASQEPDLAEALRQAREARGVPETEKSMERRVQQLEAKVEEQQKVIEGLLGNPDTLKKAQELIAENDPNKRKNLLMDLLKLLALGAVVTVGAVGDAAIK